MDIMKEQVIQKDGQAYLYFPAGGDPLAHERDALDIISKCFEHGLNKVLLDNARLSDDFLRLRTGVLGAALEKFGQYHITIAATLDPERIRGKFEDFLAESNRGTIFRAYPTYEEAESWLLGR